MPGLTAIGRAALVDLAVGLVLVWVTVEDLRRFRIRNPVVVMLGTGFVVACLVQDRAGLILPHAIFALVGLALLFGAFSLGFVGGGDAKLLTVALLWVGPDGAFVFSLALLVCALGYVAGAKLGWLPSRDRAGRTEIPFGPSIAAAWMAVLVLSAYLRAHQG